MFLCGAKQQHEVGKEAVLVMESMEQCLCYMFGYSQCRPLYNAIRSYAPAPGCAMLSRGTASTCLHVSLLTGKTLA